MRQPALVPVRRLKPVAGALWTIIACGAGLGFVARDLLGLPRTAVAAAWVLGAILGAPSAVRLGWKRRESRICTAKGG
jgi:hypothetical protein